MPGGREPDAHAWLGEHVDELVGAPAASAADVVARAGLHSRVAAPGQALTLAFRPDRVTLLMDSDGLVTEATAG